MMRGEGPPRDSSHRDASNTQALAPGPAPLALPPRGPALLVNVDGKSSRHSTWCLLCTRLYTTRFMPTVFYLHIPIVWSLKEGTKPPAPRWPKPITPPQILLHTGQKCPPSTLEMFTQGRCPESTLGPEDVFRGQWEFLPLPSQGKVGS